MEHDIKYLIVKETYSYRPCSNCKGSGKITRTFRQQKFTDTCRTCRGTCREKITHRTEVPIEEALNHLKHKSNEK